MQLYRRHLRHLHRRNPLPIALPRYLALKPMPISFFESSKLPFLFTDRNVADRPLIKPALFVFVTPPINMGCQKKDTNSWEYLGALNGDGYVFLRIFLSV